MEYSIVTEKLKIGYDENIIVPSLDIAVVSGKITSVIGANGCGKSTVLKAIGRIIRSKSGTIIINNMDLQGTKSREIAKQMAILPQTPNAPGTLTCAELVAYGRFPYRRGFGKLNKEDKEIVDWALSVTNMSDFSDREIASLSGGQRQRVWIAMALAQQTGIILLDEPTTYLDLCHQLEVLELLKKLNETQGTTIVMVLHDLNLASRYSHYLLAMRNGRVEKFGTPQEVMTHGMLADCFRIDGDIVSDPRSGKPMCISFDLFSRGKRRRGYEKILRGSCRGSSGFLLVRGCGMFRPRGRVRRHRVFSGTAEFPCGDRPVRTRPARKYKQPPGSERFYGLLYFLSEHRNALRCGRRRIWPEVEGRFLGGKFVGGPERSAFSQFLVGRRYGTAFGKPRRRARRVLSVWVPRP